MRRSVGSLDRNGRQNAVGLGAIALVCLSVLAGCQQRAGPEDPIVSDVRYNRIAALRSFLKEGGDPNFKSRDNDPLLYIAAGPLGGVEVAQILIAAGADVEAKSRNKRTPLENAVGWCNFEIIALLAKAGARLPDDQQDDVAENCIGPDGLPKSTSRVIRDALPGK